MGNEPAFSSLCPGVTNETSSCIEPSAFSRSVQWRRRRYFGSVERYGSRSAASARCRRGRRNEHDYRVDRVDHGYGDGKR
jgi:hypothetical protein